MKCPKCGNEIANDSLFCEYCGEKIQEKKRHGFVTFWLWLMLLGNVASGVFNITQNNYAIWIYASEAKVQEFFYFNHSIGDYYYYAMIAIGCFALINAIGTIMLLKWKKNGFWLFVTIAVVNLCVMCSFAALGGMTDTVVQSMIGAVAGPTILYLILQLKKEGVNCWSLLE